MWWSEVPWPLPVRYLVLQRFLDAVAAGSAIVPIGHVYAWDESGAAHHDMERGTYAGKLVVVTPSTAADRAS
jgi:hypothetical protein